MGGVGKGDDPSRLRREGVWYRYRAARVGPALQCCLVLAATGCKFENGSAFEYALRDAELQRGAVRASRAAVYSDTKKLVEDKFADIEARWRNALPIAGGEAQSTPISEWETSGRGQYSERSDYTLNRQPGVAPLGGPRSDARENFPINGAEGGNFCDQGSVNTRCIVHRELRFDTNFTLSGQGRTPFARTAYCSCKTLGCACKVEIGDFLPEFADLSWARLSVEVERGGVQVGATDALVKAIQVDSTLLQGQCNPPRLCAPGAPSESLTVAGPAVCDPVCDEWHTCASARDVSELALDGHLEISVESGNWQFAGGTCDGNILHVRVRMEGEYTGQGTLEVRGGGGIFCVLPNCTITVQDFRQVSFLEGSVVATDGLVVRAPALYIGGTVETNRLEITAGALNISAAGVVLTDDTKRHSRADIDVRPGSLAHDAKFLPEGCHANCLPCTCLVVDGVIKMTRIIISGLSLKLGVSGHIASDALGHLAATGPGAGHTSAHGGGGAGFGGWGSAACGSGGAGGGAAYGLAAAPNAMGYCALGSKQATFAKGCSSVWDMELGSGGGHGGVEGGQGGGAIRIHTDVEAVIDGHVTANGEDSACTQVLREGPVLDRWDQQAYPGDTRQETPPFDTTSSVYTYLESIPGGGGGSGGSIWVISPRIIGHGMISAVGGSANRSCHTVAAVTSGGAGGGGRIVLDYTVSSQGLRIEARGGTSLCTAAGAGTHFDPQRRLVLIDNGGGASGVSMAGDLPASFGSLQDLPTLTAAMTPWSDVQGLDTEQLRRQYCAFKRSDPLPFGCLLNVNATPPRVLVRAGAVAEIPTETVSEILVTNAATLLLSERSRSLDVQGVISVEDGAVLGCLGCAGSFETLNGMPGCNDTCPSWSATSKNGSIVIKGGAKALGVHVQLMAKSGEVVLAEDSALLASDWHVLSTIQISSNGGDLKIYGQVHYSKVVLDGAHNVFIGEHGWVGTDAMGHFGSTGPGAGGMSLWGDDRGGGAEAAGGVMVGGERRGARTLQRGERATEM